LVRRGRPRADIISALNFSILYLRDEGSLLRYLRHARACLNETGVLVLNLFGGPGAVQRQTMHHRVTPRSRLSTEAAIPPFDYLSVGSS
jgi:hypothetical protein